MFFKPRSWSRDQKECTDICKRSQKTYSAGKNLKTLDKFLDLYLYMKYIKYFTLTLNTRLLKKFLIIHCCPF